MSHFRIILRRLSGSNESYQCEPAEKCHKHTFTNHRRRNSNGNHNVPAAVLRPPSIGFFVSAQTCFGEAQASSSACSSHGYCIANNICVCNSGYTTGHGSNGDEEKCAGFLPLKRPSIELYGVGDNGAYQLQQDSTAGTTSLVKLNATSSSATMANDEIIMYSVAAYLNSYSSTSAFQTFTWGEAQRTGTGLSTNFASPVKINTGSWSIRYVDAREHTVVISSDNQLYGWGKNSDYTIDSSGTDRSTPVSMAKGSIDASTTIVAVSCGRHITLFLTLDGKVYSQGTNVNNDYFLGISALSTNDFQTTPAPVDGLTGKTVVAITAGDFHSHIITSDNQVYGWGKGFAVGEGTGNDFKLPTLIDMSPLGTETPVQLCDGTDNGLLLTKEGHVFGWGVTNDGSTGTGTTLQLSPGQIAGSISSQFVTQITCMASLSVALDESGNLHRWGTTTVFGKSLEPVLIDLTFNGASILNNYRVPHVSAGNGYILVDSYAIPYCYGIRDDNSTVCSGRGTCSGEDLCVCNTGYAGLECEWNVCFDYYSNDTVNVCSGRGSCYAPDLCNCTTGYDGPECELNVCYGYASNDTARVCSGRGTCDAPDLCNCTTGYDGVNCELNVCYGYASNDTANVCSGKGTCYAPDSCNCTTGYAGTQCELFICDNYLSNDTVNVCSGRGSCYAPDLCNCTTGYDGVNCELNVCYGYASNDTANVCSGRGSCNAPNSCNCTTGYDGPECELYVCYNYLSNDTTNVCSGRGTCTGPDTCNCTTGYTGSNCELNICHGYASNDTVNVCSGRGDCIAPDTCNCSSSYSGSNCDVIQCGDYWSNDTTNVCMGRGDCIAPDTCNCTTGYSSTNCELYYCFGILYNDSLVCNGTGVCSAPDVCEMRTCFGVSIASDDVCSGHGSCIAQDQCECIADGSYMGTHCNVTACFSIEASNSSACSTHGSCVGPNNCSCSDGYSGQECDSFICYGQSPSDAGVCSGHGTCVGANNCSCVDGYTGDECSSITCYGYETSDSGVCSGHGTCVGANNCSCADGYTGDECNVYTCYGKLASDANVCSSHGTCVGSNNCSCSTDGGYLGDECENFACFGLLPSDGMVCSSHGTCVGSNNCSCNGNYSGSACDEVTCNGIAASDASVCNGQGSCTGVNQCTCNDGYGDDDCSAAYCFGVLSTSAVVCSGHGTCISPNTCQCNSTNWTGDDCGTQSIIEPPNTSVPSWLYGVMVVPIVAILLLIVILAFCCLLCCFMCILRARKKPRRVQPQIEPLGKLDDLKELNEDTSSDISYLGVFKKPDNVSFDEFADDEFSSNDDGLYNSSFHWSRSGKNRIHPSANMSLHGGSESSESDVDISDQTIRNLVELFKKK